MRTFGEQLIGARRAKGMTQEALSQATGVTRQTISSWERGRTVPDIDSVQRLSAVLDYVFSAEEVLGASHESDAAPVVEDAAPAVEDAAPAVEDATHVVEDAAPAVEDTAMPEGAAQDPSAPEDAAASREKRRPKAPWIVAGAAVLACAVLLCLLLIPRGSGPAGRGDVFDAEAYRQETPNEPGKAYLTFDNRTWTEGSGGTDYQMYDFTLTEQNGIGFSISRIDAECEGRTGTVRSISTSAAVLETTIDPDIPAYGSVTVVGGFPDGEFIRVGIAVYGSDANGAPLTFYDLIEF